MNVRKLLLVEYQRQKAIPFAWGTADCLSFCADCAALLLGVDPAAMLRGRYESEFGARRVMVAEGWADMGAVAASMFPEIHVAQAQSGDWAHVLNPDGTETLGVVIGHQIAARAQTGLSFVSLTHAKQAFAVMPR